MIKSQTPLDSKVFFPNLDGIRTVAFLLVFIDHAFYPWVKETNFYEKLYYRPFHLLLTAGHLGVHVFFVLSGFLITYLLLQEITNTGKLHVPFFYMRRALRIWPLYFGLLGVIFLIYNNLSEHLNFPYLASNPLYFLSFLSNFEVINRALIDSYHYRILNITWSVAIEEQFYVIWPLLFIVLPQRYYAYIFILVIFISCFFRMNHIGSNFLLHYHSLTAFGSLALGGLFAFLAYNFQQFRQFFANLSKRNIIFVYIAAFLWLFYSEEFKHNENFSTPFFWLISGSFYVFIILEQTYSVNSFYKFSKLKTISYWGKYTYGLYLLHMLPIVITYDIVGRIIAQEIHNSLLVIFVESIFTLSLSLLLAYVSYEFYEKRFLKLKNRYNPIKNEGHVEATNLAVKLQ